MNQPVRVRFAPSPTGYLHVGGARTALYNYLYAKKHNGKFILRVEDTDEARSTEDSLQMVLEDLQWLGLTWDEGPDEHARSERGDFGPYKQSDRLTIYKKYADELLNSGKAYYCFMTDEEITLQREALQKAGKTPHVESPYADWSLSQAQQKLAAGGKAVVRFKTKNLKKDYIFNDLVRGEIKFPSDMVGDFVLLRSGGMPVYNFCCAVDDHLMQISHVLRAEEHLPNTLRQLMLYEALGWTPPQMGHLSIILDEDRKKLSKRKGATSCHEFKMEGYLPEALNNFIALLGWSHPEGKEILSMQELIQSFSLDRLHSAGAVFDPVKLKWMNAHRLRELPHTELFALIKPFLQREHIQVPVDPSWQEKSVAVFKSSMETLMDAIELYRPLGENSFALQPDAAEALGWDSSKKVLQTWKELLQAESSTIISEQRFLQLQDLVKEKSGAKGKFLFMPLRVAVIGKPHGTELKILIPLLSKQTLINRAEVCLQQVGV